MMVMRRKEPKKLKERRNSTAELAVEIERETAKKQREMNEKKLCVSLSLSEVTAVHSKRNIRMKWGESERE